MQKQPYITVMVVIVGVIALLSSCLVGAETIGTIANRVTGTFGDVARMITAASYLAGLGFSIGAVMKFKQHKDNPTQIPVGTPVAMLFIATALVFMPSMIGMTGATLFTSAVVGGPYGTIFLGTQ